MSRYKLYWICQISGWFAFVLLNSFFIQIEESITLKEIISLAFSFLTGIVTSHLFRNFIIRYDWLRLGFLKLLPRFLISSLVLSLIYYFLHRLLITFILSVNFSLPQFVDVMADVLNISFVYIVWSLIYFLFNFIENYKKEEIKNLMWEASRNEIELNRLKSQLNPHFMFNSMNSIRALVDEDPAKAKDAITQLSNILRNTLQMGKKKVISFEEELNIVKDYLNLEMTRYEERLKVEFSIHPYSYKFHVPPMIVQTIAENAIKHGISKLMKGGSIKIETDVEDDKMIIKVVNTGHFDKEKDNQFGLGIKNTKQRLNLVFGEKAKFSIENLDVENVITIISIPKYYESSDS
jgi:two-component system, LytTR family, sensor kinase